MDISSVQIAPAFNECKKAIVLACDQKYLKYTSVTLQSILDTCSEKYLDIIIFGSDIPKWDADAIITQVNSYSNGKASVRFFDATQAFENIYGEANCSGKFYWSIVTFYRLLIPLIMRGYSTVLYLDSDMIIADDIAKILNTNFEGAELLGVIDTFGVLYDYNNNYRKRLQKITPLGLKTPTNYFNGGMVCFSIDSIDPEKFVKDVLKYLSDDLDFLDQDVLNLVFQGKTKLLHQRYNLPIVEWHSSWMMPGLQSNKEYWKEFIEGTEDPCVLHFYGKDKIWHNPDLPFAHLFWITARKTPFYESILYSGLVPVNELKYIASETKFKFVLKKFIYSFFKTNKTIYKINKYNKIIKIYRKYGK